MAKSTQEAEVKKLCAEVERQGAVIKRLYYYVGGLLALGIASIIVHFLY